MAYKRPRESTNTETVISGLCAGHRILAPNEYSSSTIGIHGCLVRCFEAEHLARCFYQEVTVPKYGNGDAIQWLNKIEKSLKDDYQLNIERFAMVARLRRELENNKELFERSLKEINDHLKKSMHEDPLPSAPQLFDQFIQQCLERNQAAVRREIAGRMQRLQFHDHAEVGEPMNLINLRNRTQADFGLLMLNITPDSPIDDPWKTELKNLLDNSFIIVQHPSPSIATLTTPRNDTETAKLSCRLLCLLDESRQDICIANIIPVTCCLSKSDQIEENNVSYQQSPISWKTYSLATTANKQRTFYYAEMSEIILNEMLTIPQRQPLPTGKIRHSPFVYHIDFHISVMVTFPHGSEPFQHEIVVRSAPFGLIKNTSQGRSLFAEVFLEDLKRWKSMLASPPMTISVTNDSIPTTTNLTITDIVEAIRRYFIHKTGIHPKHWVMPYITRELQAVPNNIQNFLDDGFCNVLAKFLAQIDYMTEHALLILLHYDGLFLGICDSNRIDEVLRRKNQDDGEAICSMRFGSIHRMKNVKDIGIRMDLAQKPHTDLQRYTFDSDKLSLELGSFIIKIWLNKDSCYESILLDFMEDTPQLQVVSRKMTVLADGYHSKKLEELCPHEDGYTSVWSYFNGKKNKRSENSSSPMASASAQNSATANITGMYQNNGLYHSWNPNTYTASQTQHLQQPIQYPQSQNHSQSPYLNHASMAQSTMPYSFTPQNHEHHNNPTPIVVIFSSATPLTMSDENVTQFIATHLPQYSSAVQSNHIHRFSVLTRTQSTSSTTEVEFSHNISLMDLVS